MFSQTVDRTWRSLTLIQCSCFIRRPGSCFFFGGSPAGPVASPAGAALPPGGGGGGGPLPPAGLV